MTADQFRTARRALGLTQHGLAEALGFGKWGFQTIGKIERGEAPITDRTAATIRALLAARSSPPATLQP